MSLSSSLEFTVYLSAERHPVPWSIGLGHIYSVRDLFYETNLKECFDVSISNGGSLFDLDSIQGRKTKLNARRPTRIRFALTGENFGFLVSLFAKIASIFL